MAAHVTLQPRALVLATLATAAGGFVGTLIRDLAVQAEHLSSSATDSVPWTHEVPWVLLAINFFGVLAATRLLRGPLRRRDPNDWPRLLVITGFFGGLTSYSGLMVNLATLWHLRPLVALVVGVAALVSGVVAGWLGLLRRPT